MAKDKRVSRNRMQRARVYSVQRQRAKRLRMFESEVSPVEPVDTTKYVMLASGGNLLLADGSKLKLSVQ